MLIYDNKQMLIRFALVIYIIFTRSIDVNRGSLSTGVFAVIDRHPTSLTIGYGELRNVCHALR